MTIRKALIPAAGLGTRLFPASKSVKKEMFPIIGQDGIARPLIHYNVLEALSIGCEEIGIVIQPRDESIFRSFFDELPEDLHERYAKDERNASIETELTALSRKIVYIHQPEQQGFGHAVYCARDWIGDGSFLLMLGDHLFKSANSKTCARQLAEVFQKFQGSVSGVQQTPVHMLKYFGTLTGEPIDVTKHIYKVTHICEKPSAEYARAHLNVPGLPADQYLCFFGMHIFTSKIFDMLEYQISRKMRERGEYQLTSAQERLRSLDGQYYAVEIQGERFDIGIPSEFKRTIARFGEPI
ncbi:UTP--glucose-1-phosphate uridylyltransferase [candidate division KSB1 bacterium]|nr:UTP--glucose-1-phosphate uridylyltransferase [candidate division KSB1 bacterium]